MNTSVAHLKALQVPALRIAAPGRLPVQAIADNGRLVSVQQVTPPAGVPLYGCPLCGLQGLIAGSLRHHVCPDGRTLSSHLIQAVLDGDTAMIQEPQASLLQ